MYKCELTGKGKQYGSNVSFSQRHTKKVWKPNLQKKTLMVDGKKVTTDDMLFTVETVACLGACGLAPVMVVDEKVHGQMTPETGVKVVEEIIAQEQS